MKVSYGQGVASRVGSESCGAVREDGVEALTGVRAGWVSSHEILMSGVPTKSLYLEGNTGQAVNRKDCPGSAGS
jgi:hypothetical protein